jgi:hypothetical protein
MNNLKRILEKKKSQVKEVAGDRKWVKRFDTEREARPSSAVRVHRLSLTYFGRFHEWK